MIKLKVISERAERKIIRSIREASARGDRVKAARLRLELERARRYRACHAPERRGSRSRPRGATADVILTLRNRGQMSEEQFLAAEEIAEMWEAITRGRDLQAGEYEPRIRSGSGYVGPMEAMPDHLARRFRDVWTLWAGEMQRLYILNDRAGIAMGAVSWLTVAIEIAAYHAPLSHLAASLGCDRTRGVDALRNVFLSSLDAWISAASRQKS